MTKYRNRSIDILVAGASLHETTDRNVCSESIHKVLLHAAIDVHLKVSLRVTGLEVRVTHGTNLGLVRRDVV
jgi:hypothetical protein